MKKIILISGLLLISLITTAQFWQRLNGTKGGVDNNAFVTGDFAIKGTLSFFDHSEIDSLGTIKILISDSLDFYLSMDDTTILIPGLGQFLDSLLNHRADLLRKDDLQDSLRPNLTLDTLNLDSIHSTYGQIDTLHSDSILTGTVRTANLWLAATKLTSTAIELNYLDGTVVTNGGVMFGDGSKITMDVTNFNYTDANDSAFIKNIESDSTYTDIVAIGKSVFPSVSEKIYIYDASASRLRFQQSATGTGNTDGFALETSGRNVYIWQYENDPIFWGINNAYKHKMMPSGYFGINGFNSSVSPIDYLHVSFAESGTTLTSALGRLTTNTNATTDNVIGDWFGQSVTDKGLSSGWVYRAHDRTGGSEDMDIFLYGLDDGSKKLITYFDNDSIKLYIDGVKKLWLDALGLYVSHKLDVTGTTTLRDTLFHVMGGVTDTTIVGSSWYKVINGVNYKMYTQADTASELATHNYVSQNVTCGLSVWATKDSDLDQDNVFTYINAYASLSGTTFDWSGPSFSGSNKQELIATSGEYQLVGTNGSCTDTAFVYVYGNTIIQDLDNTNTRIYGNLSFENAGTSVINYIDSIKNTGDIVINANRLLINDTILKNHIREYSSNQNLTLGTNNQIPHMNSGGTDFDYGNFEWDGIRLYIEEGSDDNIFIGNSNTGNNINSKDNIGIGQSCFDNIANGAEINIGLGDGAGLALTTGKHNLLLGYHSGFSLTTADSSIYIGQIDSKNESHRLYIEAIDDTNPLIYGEFDNDSLKFTANVYITGNLWVDGTFPSDFIFDNNFKLESIDDYYRHCLNLNHLPEFENRDRKNIGLYISGLEEALEKQVIYNQQQQQIINDLINRIEKLENKKSGY